MRFLPGLERCRRFHDAVVAPILAEHLPGLRAAVTAFDWLAVPTERLAEITGGAVFHDGLGGELTAARARLRWYPDDVWRYVLACQWSRIAQDEHLVGRCAEVGDDPGSRLLAARLVRDLMRLCLLLHRRYPPYAKWLGSTFAQLPCAADIGPILAGVLAADDWPDRQEHLCRAWEAVGQLTNAAGLSDPMDAKVRPFYDRPFRVLDAGRFAAALRADIDDPWLRGLPPFGAIDQHLDNTDVLFHTARTRAVARALLLG